MDDDGRILVWFSCGAASAVAAKIAVDRYGHERKVEICYCDTSKDEHRDNARFMAAVETWIGQPILRLHSRKYSTVEQVCRGERYMIGPNGPCCSRALKRRVREEYQNPEDSHVLGFTADEMCRIDDFQERAPKLKCLWLLRDQGITKEDCYHILTALGIELPVMYRLGFNNNNCIGCLRGGKGYWNKIRLHFPDVFASRSKLQRDLGVAFRSGGAMFFLDELKPDEGRDVPEPPIECGVFCGSYARLIESQEGVTT